MFGVLLFYFYIIFPSVWAYESDCERIIRNLGGPPESFCVIMPDELSTFKKCLVDFKETLHDARWFEKCSNTELDFYRKDKEAFFDVARARSSSKEVLAVPKFYLSFDEFSQFQKNPTKYATCVSIKARAEKDSYYSSCDDQDLMATEQYPHAFTACIEAAHRNDVRFPPKEHDNCANLNLLNLFHKNPTLVDVCFTHKGNYYNVKTSECLNLNPIIVKNYPYTYAYCLNFYRDKGISQCATIDQDDASLRSTVNSVNHELVEKCLTQYPELPQDLLEVCTKFKKGKIVPSQRLEFFTENAPAVNNCYSFFKKNNFEKLAINCTNPDKVKFVNERADAYLHCLLVSKDYGFSPQYCENVDVLSVAKSFEEFGQNFSKCLRSFPVEREKTNDSQNLVSHSTLAICLSKLAHTCSQNNALFWDEYLAFVKNSSDVQSIRDYFSEVDVTKVQCPSQGHEENWMKCLYDYMNWNFNRSESVAKKYQDVEVNVSFVCEQCLSGVDELVEYDSGKFKAEYGNGICIALAQEKYFQSLTKDQLCYALANKEGFKNYITAGWRVTEGLSDLFDSVGKLFGNPIANGPTCPQYIFTPLGNDQEIEDIGASQSSPGEVPGTSSREE